MLALDHDGDVLEAFGELGRQRVERTAHVVVERHRHVYRGTGLSGGRFMNSLTVRTPKTKPPMWAKNATPPPEAGVVTEIVPSSACNRIQKPRTKVAGTSRKRKKKPRKIAVSTLARGRSRKYAPRTPAIAPLAPMLGMLASAGVPKCSVTSVCVAVAASPASRYQIRKRTRP